MKVFPTREKRIIPGFYLAFFLLIFITLSIMATVPTYSLISDMGVTFEIGISRFFIRIFYWFLMSALFTLFLWWRVDVNYVKPIQKLGRAIQAVSEGNFSFNINCKEVIGREKGFDAMSAAFNKMTEDLQNVETLKTDFLTNISHEIKTPLSVIQNYSELMRHEGINEVTQIKYADVMFQASQKISGLMTDILLLDRLEQQKYEEQGKEFNLCEQLCQCAFLFDSLSDKQGIHFHIEIEERRLITSEPGLLDLVWNNLLANAFKFTEAGGAVSLKQFVVGDIVYIVISDTGCGMDELTIRRIFDRFYQGDYSRSTIGNGLGLSLVRRVLQLLGGTIQVHSILGEGSSFTVGLPILKQTKNTH